MTTTISAGTINAATIRAGSINAAQIGGGTSIYAEVLEYRAAEGFEVRWSAPTLAGFLEPYNWCRDNGYGITGYLWDSFNSVGHLKLAEDGHAALFKLFCG